ncbi:MAG: septal ring lytic transglycosylase RlpA family protein [Defluviicoccus sp.]
MTDAPPMPEGDPRFLCRGGWPVRSIALTAILLLSACASAPEPGPSARPRDPQTGGLYKVGKPYAIKGVWYTPRVDYSYDETGIASWYGPGFHGQPTANGEVYDMNELTAAHTTLPLPSIVRVTNLDNGRTIKLRVNDRGPFIGNRIIDVSRRASQLLGFHEKGTATVRVEIEAEESRQLAAALGAPPSEPVATALALNSAAAAPVPIATAVNEEPSGEVMPEPERVSLSPTALALLAADSGQPADTNSEPAWGAEPLDEATPVAEDVPVAEDMIDEALAPARPAASREWAPRAVTRRDEPRTLPYVQAYVQAGAFSDARNAAWARQRLARLGSVAITNASADGRGLYRVRVGPFASNGEAQRVLARVISEGFAGSQVVYD